MTGHYSIRPRFHIIAKQVVMWADMDFPLDWKPFQAICTQMYAALETKAKQVYFRHVWVRTYL